MGSASLGLLGSGDDGDVAIVSSDEDLTFEVGAEAVEYLISGVPATDYVITDAYAYTVKVGGVTVADWNDSCPVSLQ